MKNNQIGPHDQSIKNNEIDEKDAVWPPSIQGELFHVDTQIEYEDIEMGVLESGLPYLSGRGLARMCGVDHKTLHTLSSEWDSQRTRSRGRAIDSLLKNEGYNLDSLCMKAEYKNKEVNAYPEPVCMAILEYYAFEAQEPREQAVRAYRNLAKLGLRDFVYRATGYNPQRQLMDSWKHFHDRTDMTMDAAPFGYFGVFREIGIMIVPMIRSGVIINDKVVPDISVGKAWSAYWIDSGLEEKYGCRMKYDHEYPDYYPQSKSNPQPSYCYPNAALGEFREWLMKNYIINKFPNYLIGQSKKGNIAIGAASQAAQSFGLPPLPVPKTKLLNP